ncbi:L-histidine N(alpha)-methyltransferase [Cereibacter azotoformans]|uniref:Dimethylhistidine N-methyltransferase n=1 Tax=Cereibacter azotoformans TaxID=43057 RepID=A0A2T5K6B0_9RHOB|nr:L-histidine N(alpha)-methyltransferase [Cereibacter azotoformans]AXQ95840.1 L-histidine N(alpha)-methyltransferase [Cereibacter sphaeroides]PTR17960.1 dimethylhistidine N-methyltransferase [Cereibacter azotoformans]UIJ32650.1 L-histidine N(alpha)-methyltransferase [Cereibacter azotoformans]
MDALVIRNPELLADALRGLSQTPKRMEPKWFYDAEGSALFERITELPEYYPTRTETAILSAGADRLASHVPEGAELVELGSGASVKTRLLLDRLEGLSAYVPVDISASFLKETARRLASSYPRLPIRPVAADFTRPLRLDDEGHPRVGFFPGSTLGNLDPDGARALMRGVRDWPGIRGFIVGIDLIKDEETLVRAYDDAAGVTAAFNLNLLHRMNREIGADFDPDRFAHRAIWNADKARIEMHLESLAAQSVQIGPRTIRFAKGETIHTENSHKFSPESFALRAAEAGWRLADFLTDEDQMFGVAVLAPV